MRSLPFRFESVQALQRAFEEDLRHGRALLADGPPLELFSRCVVVLVHPDSGREHRVQAEVVMSSPGPRGCALGLNLLEVDASALEAFARVTPEPVQEPAHDEDPGFDRRAENLYDRLRALPPVDQLRVLKKGSLAERVAMERILGKKAWPVLLDNTQLTVAEVAGMAAKPALSPGLMLLIVRNPAWLQKASVRRALLMNPRTPAQLAERVLRACPKAELQAIHRGGPFPQAVRMAASRLAKRR